MVPQRTAVGGRPSRAADRICAVLLRASTQDGDAVALTHLEIAEQADTSRETVARTLRMLAHSGCIHQRRGKLFLLDRSALEA